MVDKSSTVKQALKPWLHLIPDFRRGLQGMETPPRQECVISDIGSYIQYNRTIERADDDHISEHFCPDHSENSTTPSITKPTRVRSVRSHASSRGYRPSLPSLPSERVSNHVSPSNSLTSKRSACPPKDTSRPMTDMEYYLAMPEMNGRYPRLSKKPPNQATDSSSCGCFNSNTVGGTSYCANHASYADRHTGFLPASLDIPHVIPATTRFTLDDSSAGSSNPRSRSNSQPNSTSTPATTPTPSTPASTTPTPPPQTASFGGSDGSSDDPKTSLEKATPPATMVGWRKYTFLQHFVYKLLPLQWRIAASTTTSPSPSPSASTTDSGGIDGASPTLDDDSDIDLTYVAKTDEENQADEKMMREWKFRQKIQALVLILAISLLIAGFGVGIYYGQTALERA